MHANMIIKVIKIMMLITEYHWVIIINLALWLILYLSYFLIKSHEVEFKLLSSEIVNWNYCFQLKKQKIAWVKQLTKDYFSRVPEIIVLGKSNRNFSSYRNLSINFHIFNTLYVVLLWALPASTQESHIY